MMENPSQPPPVSNAGRLKYADPRSLPSYPSHGLRPDGAAASAAASLGWANQKPIELWKPDETSSASAAAALAKDYRMSPAWEPTANAAGAKAALLAVGSADAALKQAGNRNVKGTHDGWGNSAASQAFHATRSSSVREPNLSHGSSAATQAFNMSRTLSLRQPSNVSDSTREHRSLAAAKGAMSSSRPRARSSPLSPEQTESAHSAAASNALNGAALAHRASLKPKAPSANAGAVPVTTMTRNMFTSQPPVKPEVDEQENNEKIHQSAVAMARKMYLQQQKMLDQAKESQGDGATTGQGPQYLNLQDAAYKQAQERLAKLQTEHQNNRDLQEYYGNSQPPRRRLSTMATKLRRRSSSDGDLNDRQRSERIRQQMSLFSNKLSEVDQSKRDKDREALLAAAQRNVKARLQGMDEKVYQDTGMINPTMLDAWELKAQQAAQTRHETRTMNKGKVDIGGGKFMSPEEVDAIASKRVQPVIDDINEKAEIERERIAVLKLEEEAKKAEQEKQKARDREVKEINKKLKEQEKQEERAKKHHEKQEEKARKEEERVVKAEQKRQAKEEKRRSRQDPARPTLDTEHVDDGDANVEAEQPHVVQDTGEVPAQPAVQAANNDDGEAGQRKPGDSPTSPTSKVKGWIKNRFSRGKSIGEQSDKKRGFLGGVALRDTNASTSSLENRPSSMRDVALAGKTEPNRPSTAQDSHGVSPMSSDDEDDGPSRRRGSLTMMPPRPIEDPVIRTSSSPTRDSRFREEMDR